MDRRVDGAARSESLRVRLPAHSAAAWRKRRAAARRM